ncbi:RND family transporter, partial [bacterium]
MLKRDDLLKKWGAFIAKYPKLILMFGFIILVLAGFLASKLTMETSWSDMLPQNDPMVREFDDIMHEYTNATNTMLVVEGDEERIKEYAHFIAPKLKALTEYVKRVDYKIEEEFIKNHALMLSKAKDIESIKNMFSNLGLVPLLRSINDNFEKEYIGDEDSLSNKEDENEAIRYLDGLESWLNIMEMYVGTSFDPDNEVIEQAVERLLIGDPYFLSPKKNMLIMFIEPNFTIDDIYMGLESIEVMQKVIDESKSEFGDVKSGLTGFMAIQKDEMDFSTRDMKRTSVVALTLIMLLFILSFRIWVMPLLAAINLIAAIIMTAGFSYLIVGRLNLMTSMFGAILIGLGIDFALHVISLYNEHRANNLSAAESMKNTMVKSGSGIIVSGLTTAFAFLALLVSESLGIKEMGLVLGLGIIMCFVTSLIFLPAMLIVREKISARFKKGEYKVPNVEFKFLSLSAGYIERKPILFLFMGGLLTIFLLYHALNIKFDYNMMNIEPKNAQSVIIQDRMIEEFELSPDYALVRVDTLDEVREITKRAKEIKSVSSVDSITEYLPSDEEYEKRLPLINQIKNNLIYNKNFTRIRWGNFHKLIKELKRLHMNIEELSQIAFIGGQDKVDEKCQQLIGQDESGESYLSELIGSFNYNKPIVINRLKQFESSYEPFFRSLSKKMANTEKITLEKIPDNIKNRFFGNDQNKILLTIAPKEMIWDLNFMKSFTRQMRSIDERITGTPILALDYVKYISRDGKLATVIALVVVFLLLLFDYRKFKTALIVMIPLVVGSIWMVGIMKVFGFKLDFVNIMAVPIILGIGIDDGVHIMHRYRYEGTGSIRHVFLSTGKAVLLTSLTTMIGFGSFMIAEYRGFVGFGFMLALGVGTCFLTTLIFLPALIG